MATQSQSTTVLDLQQVARPAARFRPAPFWAWNEVMEPDEVRRQVREMARGGLGGAFMHVRVGLLTPYMSEEFFAAMAAALEEARGLGLHLYLYDEDRWPSGWGAGAVPLADPSFRTKWLLRVPAGEQLPLEGEAALLATGPDGVRYYRYLSPLNQAWFSGATYADLMDRRAMQTFLKAAYEPYAARFGADFGGLIPAIFTDEPAITFLPAYVAVPRGMLFWTDELPACFLAQHGYDILPRLQELFEDRGSFTATRTDYYRTCAWLFEEHFSKQLGAWCRAHGIAFTGHYMLEGSLTANLAWDVCTLPHYRHMDWPGIDHLGLQIHEVITGLGCRSVVNQYGKQRMVSELYGCCGQHLSFEDRKWIGEQQIILGVNLLVHHLLLYTMVGERKRDFPCNMWYQQPWWPLNQVVDDYLGRLCALLTQGSMVPEFLVLHPIESLYALRRPPSSEQGAWATHHTDDAARLTPLDEGFQALSHYLLGHQRQFDYGDETVLADCGTVENDGDAPLLRVGAMTYPLVLLPDLASIRAGTLALLERFAAAGGPVLSTGSLPWMLDGRADRTGRLVRFLEQHVRRVDMQGENDLASLLDRRLLPLVSVEVEGPRQWLWHHTRRAGDAHIILLANLHRAACVTGTLHLGPDLRGPLFRLDLVNNTAITLYAAEGPLPAMPLLLDPGESLVLVAGDAVLAGFSSGSRPSPSDDTATLATVREWSVERLDDNALTLDMAGFRRRDEPFGTPCPVIAIQEVLNDTHYDGPLTLRYALVSELAPASAGTVRLVLEHPEQCTVRINGQIVEEDGLPPWRDMRWRQLAIGHSLRQGENCIEVEYPTFQHGDPNSTYDQSRRYGTEIESIYVVGEFGVRSRPAGDLSLTEPPEPTPPWALCAVDGPFALEASRSLAVGNLVEQGLPFYAGRISCRASLSLDDLPAGPVWLALERLSVPVVEVLVNGRPAGTFAWRPYRVAIDSFLVRGENRIELVLYHSLRNLLGPHHFPAGEEYGTGPHSFRGQDADWADLLVRGEEGAGWRPSYALTEFGLFGTVRVLVAGGGAEPGPHSGSTGEA